MPSHAFQRAVNILAGIIGARYDSEVDQNSIQTLFWCEITYFFPSLQENNKNYAFFSAFFRFLSSLHEIMGKPEFPVSATPLPGFGNKK